MSTAVPHFVQSIAGIGTPQARWREMHQSGRLAIMPSMRAWPHDGIQRTRPRISSSARARRSCESMAMNHCAVARKITGLWQRQQCG